MAKNGLTAYKLFQKMIILYIHTEGSAPQIEERQFDVRYMGELNLYVEGVKIDGGLRVKEHKLKGIDQPPPPCDL